MTDALLTNDHAKVGAIFSELCASLSACRKERAFELLDMAWARLAVHIRAEHLRLFPAILDALAASQEDDEAVALVTLDEARDLFARLREDHNFFMDEMASAVKIMRELLASTDNESEARSLSIVRSKIDSVASRLEQHNRLEEEKLYRWPAMLLNRTEQARLETDVRREIQNLPARLNNVT